MNRPSPTLVVTVSGILVLASCGAGTGAVGALLGKRNRGGSDSPTTIGDVLPSGSTRTSPLQFSFRLTDADATPVDVDVHYVLGSDPPVPLLLTGSPPLDALATSGAGVVHVLAWDFAGQIPAGAGRTPQVRLLVQVRNTNIQASSPSFACGNDAPVVQVTSVPAGEVVGPVLVDLMVADSGSDNVAVLVEYDRLDDAAGWQPASPIGVNLANVAASVAGTQAVFLWDVTRDEPAAEFTARLRFTPADDIALGAAVETATVSVDNNAAPVVLVEGSAFVADPDRRRGLPVPFEMQDPEGDPILLVWQWRTATGQFPALPADPAAMAAARADPAQRATLQIASPFPVAETGLLEPIGPTTARALDLLRGDSIMRTEFVVGRTLQAMRRSKVPAGAAAGWVVDPLSAPVALQPVGNGESVLVLEQPAAGQWRLREVRLADGAVLATLAGGTDGSADGLAPLPDGSGLLVAVELAGTWALLRVDLPGGAVTPLYTTGGANAVGSVRGVAAPTATSALVTVADKLIQIDLRGPGPPNEHVVLAGLATPSGIAVDQRNPGVAFVAERDWVDPSSGNPDGRLISVELGRPSVQTMLVAGVAALRPSAVALSADRASLWFTTDEVVGNGTVELRSVRLNGGAGGPGFTLATGLPDSATGITTGPLGLVLVCEPAQDDLAVGGGVVQSRAIVAFDPATGVLTVDSPFSPAVVAGDPWRIAFEGDLPAGAVVRRGTFVWDSADAPPGEQVVLQATPFDTDRGIATNTGVPRGLSVGLHVTPQTIGGVPANNGVRALRLADLNGDGMVDLASANTTQNTLSVFLQNSPGVFSTAADVTVSNLLQTGPNDLALLDIDGDGDLDIAVANNSNSVSLVLHGTASSFTTVPLLTLPASSPRALAVGDLDGDGREDLVCANRGSNDLRVFLQLPAGLFLPIADQTLTDPAATAPVDVELADLDGDGDLDIVSCNETSDTVTVFRQTASGTFAQPASAVLGGPGVTDAPVALALRDFDLDGRTDIAVANRDGNGIAVFMQQADGTFLVLPTVVLSSSVGPTQPRSIAAADVDGDGAPDLIVADSAHNVLAFFRDPVANAFRPKPQVLSGSPLLSAPTACVLTDLDGDGRVDLALANESAGNAALLLQARPGSFRGQTPGLSLGGAATTPGVAATVAADVDGDGDLDLVLASADDGTLSVHLQLAPSIFTTDPTAVLGDAATAGVRSVVAADFDGDGRCDLATANAAAGTVTLFFGAAAGLPAVPDIVLGAGTLQQPVHLVAADTDSDGDLDLVCADAAANRLFAFAQLAPGAFDPTPLVLGSDAATSGPNTVVATDLDGDGDVDLACSCTGSNNVAVFFQTAAGVFAATPDRVLGGAGTTAQAKGLVVGLLDADGLPDLACVSGPGNTVAVFLATAAGTWSATPSALLTGAEIQDPCALAVADLDGDGATDLVVANRGTLRLASLLQVGNGVFPLPASGFGGSGVTDDASQLLLVDLDHDGDADVVSVHPGLDSVKVFFNAH